MNTLYDKDKIVTVYDKSGRKISPCTQDRAINLLSRKVAKPFGVNTIKLVNDYEDKKRIRLEVIQEANRQCYICGDFIPLDVPATIDHVIPKKQLGAETKENFRCCCKRCNDDKSNRTIQEYIHHIEVCRVMSIQYNYLDFTRIQYLKNIFS